jgi:SPP1 family predicted phage head-tail adaptor
MPKNSRITIQQRSTGRDEGGQPIEGWTTVATLWAEVRDITGREYIAAGAEQAEVTTRVRIWRRAGIKPAMRVLRGTTTYDIKAVLDEGRDGTLLICTRREQ